MVGVLGAVVIIKYLHGCCDFLSLSAYVDCWHLLYLKNENDSHSLTHCLQCVLFEPRTYCSQWIFKHRVLRWDCNVSKRIERIEFSLKMMLRFQCSCSRCTTEIISINAIKYLNRQFLCQCLAIIFDAITFSRSKNLTAYEFRDILLFILSSPFFSNGESFICWHMDIGERNGCCCCYSR